MMARAKRKHTTRKPFRAILWVPVTQTTIFIHGEGGVKITVQCDPANGGRNAAISPEVCLAYRALMLSSFNDSPEGVEHRTS